MNTILFCVKRFIHRYFGRKRVDVRDRVNDIERDTERDIERDRVKLRKIQRKILTLMFKNRDITTSEMAALLNVSTSTISREIATLKERGCVRRVGSCKTGDWVVNVPPHQFLSPYDLEMLTKNF